MLEYLTLLAYALLMPVLSLASVYALGWITLCLVRFVPLIGRKYRHDRWDELNRESNVSSVLRRPRTIVAQRAHDL